jgi:hypothetical protein
MRRWKKMAVRVYMLLDIVDRNCEYAVQMLRSKADVILADRLEGYPNIIAAVEAADRQDLAVAVIPVLDCLDGITEGLHLLVAQGDEISHDLVASNGPAPHKTERRNKPTARETTISGKR